MQTKRRSTPTVKIAQIQMGGKHPIIIQSMTNTPTADVKKTVNQIIELAKAGSELVRITINDEKAMQAVPEIIKQVRGEGLETPILGDFHFNGHLLLAKFPECAKLLAKFRINPGNVGQEKNFDKMIEIARDLGKAVRIGVNWGSIDQKLFTQMMNANAQNKNPKSDKELLYEVLVKSALDSAAKALEIGLPKNKIVLSIKTSEVPDLINVNRILAKKCDFPIHLGLTEAGSGVQGLTSSAAALGILLSEGIGDTIRISLTPTPGAPRSQEVEACLTLLQALELRYFKPKVTSCPGCGRTASDYFIKLTAETKKFIDAHLEDWKQKYPGVEKLHLAVMGCVVNGPGECKNADLGICLPGAGEEKTALIFQKGKLLEKLSGDRIRQSFQEIILKYLEDNFNLKN